MKLAIESELYLSVDQTDLWCLDVSEPSECSFLLEWALWTPSLQARENSQYKVIRKRSVLHLPVDNPK